MSEKRDPLEGLLYAHAFGETPVLEMDREQLLDVIRDLLGELEAERGFKEQWKALERMR